MNKINFEELILFIFEWMNTQEQETKNFKEFHKIFKNPNAVQPEKRQGYITAFVFKMIYNIDKKYRIDLEAFD